jgi:hypothetical protein
MHEQTRAELIEAVGTAGTSLLKEMFSRQQEMNMMEKRAEMEKEIAHAKSENTSLEAPEDDTHTHTDGTVVETLGRAEELATEYDDLLQRAEAKESCHLCKNLLRGARNRPVAEQQELLPALREFFTSVEDDTPTDVVAQRMRQHDALMDLVQSEMQASG